MATKKQTIEYGVLVAPVGTVDSEKSLSKRTFFERLEAEYPSADGWQVVERTVTPMAGQETVVVSYHVERKVGKVTE